MTREMTGAEMVIQALADQGVKHLFGYPGGAVLPIYDALFAQTRGAAHPGAARAGRGARGGRLCALDRQGRLRAGHLRPRRDQCGDRPDRRADGFDPAGLHHRPGADASDRQRRVPGMRHRRHHAAVHQAQLSGQAHRGSCRACCTRRSTSLRAAGPGPVVVDIPKDIQFAKGVYSKPKDFPHTGYKPKVKGDIEQDQGGRRIDGARQAAAVLHRRRRDQFRQARQRSAARTGQAHRLSDHLDADGARRVSRRRSAVDGHARHARHARSQHGDARLRRR